MTMNPLRLGLALSFFACSAFAADEADPRMAKITDRADVTSQISAVVVSNLDERFGFDHADARGRLVVTTPTIFWSVPLRAVSVISLSGDDLWTVKYRTTDGETSVSGGFEPAAVLSGNSDFGSFSLPLVKLTRLEFDQPGVPMPPARRPNIFDQDARLRPGSFGAVLTLADGSRLVAVQLRRNQVAAESVSDPALIARPSYAVVCTNYTDFRFLRGETSQTIPFENVKKVEFLPDDVVEVTVKSGAEAKMKLPERHEETLEGFTGNSTKGDFYVPVRFVKVIEFAEPPK